MQAAGNLQLFVPTRKRVANGCRANHGMIEPHGKPRGRNQFMKLFLFSLCCTCAMSNASRAAEPSEEEKTSVIIEYSQAVYDFSGDQKKVILEGPITISTQTMKITCDHAEVLSSRNATTTSPTDTSTNPTLGTIDYILALGNVDIEQMGTRALAGKAEIFPLERRLVLEDNPRIIDKNGIVSGFRITFLQGDRQIKIEPGDSNVRNRIQLNDISEFEFLMGEKPPVQPELPVESPNQP